MEKAGTIKEIYKAFASEKFLHKEDEAFYVDLYKRDLRRFVNELEENDIPTKSFFIAGQSGNGKSTLLNFLDIQYPSLNEKYELRYLSGKVIFQYADINIIDLFLMIGSHLIEENETLQKKYLKELNILQESHDGLLQIETVNANTKEAKASELIKIINEIILDYKLEHNNGKEILLIIDDLEKKENIDNLYLKELQHLNSINMVKIITMPIHLRRTQTFNSKDVREFALKLNEDDKKLLRKVIEQRIENLDLISSETIDKAIKYSGGNLRQLIRLIQLSANEADTFGATKIENKEINYAIEFLQRGLSSPTMLMQNFLKEILESKMLKTNTEENLQKLDKAIDMGLIFAYSNAKTWYEINPLIKDILKEYLGVTQDKIYTNTKLETKNKYINNIKINNYFSIEHIELKDLEDKKEIYFVGENGDGKTILLQALALAYKDNYPILALKYLENIKNEFSFDIEDKFINHNLFAYGINRNKTNADDVDKSGYSSLFDTPNINDTTSLNRPQDLFILDNAIVKEFIKGVEYLLENKIKITQRGNETIFSETSNESIDIEFKMLSEGYKSTIIWLSDLLFRLMKNQPNINSLKEFKAVVLIDEIDLYLHPKWKYQFVHRLREMFPNIQFIMTTHSITTILGARADAIFYQVYKDEEGFTQLSDKIDDISDYSANILITSPLFNMQSAKSRSYDDAKNRLSDDDYREHQLNRDIDKMLQSDESKKIKLDILNQLKEL